MNPWIVIALIGAGIVFLIDFLFRRKKWKANTKAEKASLIVQMACVGPNFFLSALGLFWGIGGGSPETAFGNVLYEVTLTMAALYFIVALVATITAFVLHVIRKNKASIWINVSSVAYAVVIMFVNYLIGVLF